MNLFLGNALEQVAELLANGGGVVAGQRRGVGDGAGLGTGAGADEDEIAANAIEAFVELGLDAIAGRDPWR